MSKQLFEGPLAPCARTRFPSHKVWETELCTGNSFTCPSSFCCIQCAHRCGGDLHSVQCCAKKSLLDGQVTPPKKEFTSWQKVRELLTAVVAPMKAPEEQRNHHRCDPPASCFCQAKVMDSCQQFGRTKHKFGRAKHRS